MQEQFVSSDKRPFEPPKIEIVLFEAEDVITESTRPGPMSTSNP